MKIGFIGIGKLGLDCAEVMAEKHEVRGYDIYPRTSNTVKVCDIDELVNESEWIFIAVPTPHAEGYDGSIPSSHMVPKDFGHDAVIDAINQENNNKRRSGNKIFRYIVPTEIKDKTQTQQALVFRTLCQLWLVRQDYTFHPTDNEVCKDYIQSYILDGKRKISKKSLIDPHPMQHAVNWWRGQQGWASKQIEIGNWCAWQSQ